MNQLPLKIPKGLIVKEQDIHDYVRSVNSPIPYIVRNDTGDWTPYLAQKQPQKYGNFETNDCWCLAGINDLETQCNFLKAKGQFTQETLSWFKDNGYFDSNMKFDFSERFIGIISGAKDNGNDQIELWRLSHLNGVLPRKDLAYTDSQASQFASQEAFANDYFNPSAIKPEMRQKALNSLQYLSIAYEWIGRRWTTPNWIDIKATLLCSPLQIGVPVSRDINVWNSGDVIYDGKTSADHSILLKSVDQKYNIFDHYNPYDKTLSKDYYIPLVTHGYVSPILKPPYVPPVTAEKYPTDIWSKVWSAVYLFFRNTFYK